MTHNNQNNLQIIIYCQKSIHGLLYGNQLATIKAAHTVFHTTSSLDPTR